MADDTLREQLARRLHEADKDGAKEKYGITFRAWSDLTDEVRQDYYDEVDLLLPLIREHTATAVQGERERLQRVEALREYWDTHDPYRVGIHANQLRAALDGTETDDDR